MSFGARMSSLNSNLGLAIVSQVTFDMICTTRILVEPMFICDFHLLDSDYDVQLGIILGNC